MLIPNEPRAEHILARFEGREAIYVEQGALCVKVRNIHEHASQRFISAEVEEIPTLGFPAGVFSRAQFQPHPLRWSIKGGYLTAFSGHTWNAGYGLWCLFFDPTIIAGVLSLASRFPEALDPLQRYNEVLQYLQDHEAYEPAQRFFARP
jgi:hypothetical protein